MTSKQQIDQTKTAAAAIAGMLLYDPDGVARTVDKQTLTDILTHYEPGIIGATFKAARAQWEQDCRFVHLALYQAVRDAGFQNADIDTLTDVAPLSHEAPHYAALLLDGIIRKEAAKRLQDHSHDIQSILAELQERVGMVAQRGRIVAAKTLQAIPPPIPEQDNPAALFRHGYLRKGGAAMLVSTSGVGKSVFSIQASLHWAAGRPCFGIDPVKPLEIAIFQTEDDDEELYSFRQDITVAMVENGTLTENEARDAAENITLCDCTGAVGDEFVSRLASLVKQRPDIDLVIANPLQAICGGDLSKNNELSAFLRTGIDPVIKPARVGLFIIHHTNKPPASKERNGWGSDAFAAYVGAGGAELTNWVRAALALMPCDDAPGVFRLTAAKRGQKLGWRDDAGLPVNYRFIAHSDGRIFWREASYAEGLPVKERTAETPQIDWQAIIGNDKIAYMELLDAIKISCQVGTHKAKNAIRDGILSGKLTTGKEGRNTFYMVKGMP